MLLSTMPMSVTGDALSNSEHKACNLRPVEIASYEAAHTASQPRVQHHRSSIGAQLWMPLYPQEFTHSAWRELRD
jgi:hypothetical protein